MSDTPPGIAVTQFSSDETWRHVDVSDGAHINGINLAAHPDVSFEAHLLMTDPEKYIKPLVDSGFRRLIVHVESNDPRRFLSDVKFEEVEVGVALDGTTDIAQLEPFVEEVDCVLFSDADADVVGKVVALHQSYPVVPIEVEGEISDTMMQSLIDAGATRVVRQRFE